MWTVKTSGCPERNQERSEHRWRTRKKMWRTMRARKKRRSDNYELNLRELLLVRNVCLLRWPVLTRKFAGFCNSFKFLQAHYVRELYEVCASLDQDDEDAEDLEDAFYENQLDPISLLESMGRHATGSQEGEEFQPYQVLNNTARQARARHVLPSGRSKKQQEAGSDEEVCHSFNQLLKAEERF